MCQRTARTHSFRCKGIEEDRANRRRKIATRRLLELCEDPSSLKGREFDYKSMTPESAVFDLLRGMLDEEEREHQERAKPEFRQPPTNDLVSWP